jgi:hypothetical protein
MRTRMHTHTHARKCIHAFKQAPLHAHGNTHTHAPLQAHAETHERTHSLLGARGETYIRGKRQMQRGAPYRARERPKTLGHVIGRAHAQAQGRVGCWPFSLAQGRPVEREAEGWKIRMCCRVCRTVRKGQDCSRRREAIVGDRGWATTASDTNPGQPAGAVGR